jgi:hypothetical protein
VVTCGVQREKQPLLVGKEQKPMHPTELEEYFKARLAQLDWNAITEAMLQHGFVVLEKFLTEEQCDLAKTIMIILRYIVRP